MTSEGKADYRPDGVTAEAAYRLIGELTSDYAYSVSVVGTELRPEWATDGFEKLTGFTISEIEERGGWSILIHPDSADTAAAGLETILAGDALTNELRLVTKSGATLWVRTTTKAVLDPEGNVVRIFGVAQDITEQKLARQEIETYQSRLRASFEEAAIGIAIVLRSDVLSTANAELGRILGRPLEDIAGRPFEDLAVPEDEHLVRGLASRLAARPDGKERFLVRLRHADDSSVVARVTASLIRRPSGDPDYVVVQIADVTAHHNDLELLRARERLLAEAEQVAHVGSWEWDLDADRVVVSEEVYRIWGLDRTRPPSTSRDYLRHVVPEDRGMLVGAVTEAAHAREPFGFFVRIIRAADGEVRTLQVHGQPEPDPAPHRMFGAVWDVTDHIQAQSEVAHEAARLRLLSSIARASNTSNVDEALEVALREVCLFAGWDVGHCFLVDDEGSLISTGIWFQRKDSDIGPFRSASAATVSIVPGGLLERAAQSLSYASVPKITGDPSVGRRSAAERAGFTSAHVFPVLSGDEVLGMLEFFSFERTEVGSDLEDLMNTIGVQLGRTLERQRAARALGESEERFRSLADAAVDSIVSADQRGIIWYANPATEQVFGYSPGELVGKPLTAIMPERLRNRHTAALEAFVRVGHGEAMGKLFYQVGLRKDGSEFPVEIALSHQRTSVGIVFTSMIRDVSEQRRAADELAQRQQQLEEAQLRASMGSWEWEPATETLLYSKGLLSMLGFPEDADLSFAELQKVVHPADLDDLIITSERIASEGGGHMFRLFRALMPDGSVKLIETRAQIEPDAEGGVGRIVGVDQDVTERKRAERLLECQAEVLQKVAMREPLDHVLECIAHGIEREADGALCSIMLVEDRRMLPGAAPNLPDSFTDSIYGLPIGREAVCPCGRAAFLGHEVLIADITGDALWPDFSDLAVSHDLRACWSCPILSEGREVIGTFALYYRSPREPSLLDRQLVEAFSALASVAIETDRAERAAARLEAQYRHAQKMEAVGQLAGGIAHDFNNLLQAILSSAELLSESLTADDARREDLETVVAGGRRGASLVRQLLTFARREPLEPRVLDLNRCVTELTPLIRATIGESIELKVALDPRGVLVEIDPGSFEQLLLNLVSNARDAVGRGGNIWIETVAEIAEAGFASGGVTVVVRDNGPGMTPEVAARAFDPFFTTKEIGKGSGLGLASVHGAVEAAGGRVHLESSPGAGLSVFVYLPASRGVAEEVSVPQAGPATQVHTRTSPTILLAEDETIVAEALTRALTRRGYRVVSAPDGTAALEAGLSDSVPIDVIVTDVVMPGVSGPELVRRLREAGRSVRVLYMSGYSEDVLDRRHLLEEGDAYIAKPFTPEALAAAVERLVDGVSSAGRGAVSHPNG